MSLTDELERLQTLRAQGALTEAEYELAKARVLGGAAPAAGTGAPETGPFAGERSFFHQLARSRGDRWIGGVCGGLGRHTDLPSWAWRLIFCLVTLYFGAGILFYVLLWIFLPEEA
jgi:phage shock protein PspC (stress-responsive transcriptional regulator)